MYASDARSDTILARRTLRLSSLWRITDVLGGVLRFTDHDRDIVYDGYTFQSAGAPVADSREVSAGLSGGGTAIAGVLDSDLISEEDIAAGLYDDARVDEILVDWQYPDVVGPLLERTFWISKIVHRDNAWQAELVTMADRLARRAGQTLGRRCGNELGEGICGLGVNLNNATYKKSGTIATLVDRRQFTSSALGSSANMFRHGTVTWTSGANAGFVSDVKSYTVGTETFVLQLPPPHEMQVGDGFDARAGCDYEFTGDCTTKFNNRKNFRGAHLMPGTGKATRFDV